MFLLTHPKGERISTEAQLDSLIKTITYRDSTDGELRILGSTRRGLLQRAEANAIIEEHEDELKAAWGTHFPG